MFQSIPTKYLFSIFLILYLTHSFNLCVLNSSVSHFQSKKQKTNKQTKKSTTHTEWNENIFCHIWASLQCRKPGFDPWVGKIPWRRERLPTPVFLPGESPWTEELGGLQSMGLQKVGHDWATRHTVAAISINNKCHSHQQFLASTCEWGLPKLWSSRCHHPPRWLLKRLSNARSSHQPLLKGNKEIGFGHR